MTPAKSYFDCVGRISFIVQVEAAARCYKIDRRTIRNALVPQQVSLKKMPSADHGKDRFGDLMLAVVDRQARLTITMQGVGLGSTLKSEYRKIEIFPVRKTNRVPSGGSADWLVALGGTESRSSTVWIPTFW